jgi:hypothetical protein
VRAQFASDIDRYCHLRPGACISNFSVVRVAGYGFEGTAIGLKIRGRVKRSERKRFAGYFAL